MSLTLKAIRKSRHRYVFSLMLCFFSSVFYQCTTTNRILSGFAFTTLPLNDRIDMVGHPVSDESANDANLEVEAKGISVDAGVGIDSDMINEDDDNYVKKDGDASGNKEGNVSGTVSTETKESNNAKEEEDKASDNKDVGKSETAHSENTKRRAPLVIGAGRGTTGTHTMTEAMCILGYPSVHYNVACVPKENIVEVTGEEGPFITEEYFDFIAITQKIAGSFGYVTRCLKSDDGCDHPAHEITDSIANTIDTLINYTTTMNVIPTLHDSPYAYIMPTLIKAVKKYYNGSMPGIVLTERDPETYVTRRVNTLHAGSDVICKEAGTIQPATLENGAFNFIGCYERYVSGLSEDEAKAVTIGQIFTTIGKIYSNETNDEGAAYVVNQVKEYQDAVRSIADFSVDLFAREGRVSKEALADEIESNVDAFEQERGDMEYVKIWRTKKAES